ncbi:MAG: JAB domain-containing protein, partial [Opitutaceae bacterium]
MLPSPGTAPLLNRADLIAAHFRPSIQGLVVERFFVALLNRKSRLVKQVEITSGTATATLASPRDVFRVALREGATVPVTALVCVHNHPGNSSEPSAADTHVTRLLREASKTVDIELLDHVIVVADPAADPNGKGYFSYREAGLL